MMLPLHNHTLPRAQASNKDASYNQLGPTHPIISQHVNSHHLPHRESKAPKIHCNGLGRAQEARSEGGTEEQLTASVHPRHSPRALLWALLTGTHPV